MRPRRDWNAIEAWAEQAGRELQPAELADLAR
jgi:hypothetical protein